MKNEDCRTMVPTFLQYRNPVKGHAYLILRTASEIMPGRLAALNEGIAARNRDEEKGR